MAYSKRTKHLNQHDFDWDDLKYFLAIAQAGTLRGGASNMNANHATVSRKIDHLEQKLKTRLFDRTQSGLALTPAGEDLLPIALRVEEEMNAVSRTVMGRDHSPTGTIHFSMPPIMSMSFIMDDIATFSHQYPDIDLHIDLTNEFVNLSKRESDVTLRIAKEIHEDVVGRKLSAFSKAAYCSHAYAQQISDTQGQGIHWIGWNEPENHKTADWILESAYPKAELRHRVGEGIPQISLAAANVGLIMLPCFIGERIPSLIRAPYQHSFHDHRSIWLLLHHDLRKTARVRLFVDFIAEKIKGRRKELLIEFKS